MVFHWLAFVFDMFPVDFNRRTSPDLRLCYDFIWFSIGFPLVLLCFRLILIVGPRPIFVYLLISDRFPLVFLCFAMFLVDFNRRPSPDQPLSYDFLWFWIGFLMVLQCFQLILSVGPRPIFGRLMFSYSFRMVFLRFCNVSG